MRSMMVARAAVLGSGCFGEAAAMALSSAAVPRPHSGLLLYAAALSTTPSFASQTV
jgi:cation diffusion facilitator CzcD-associated flavoprotein CzcO